MASTGGGNQTCEAQLVALCNQLGGPVPVCYSFGGVATQLLAHLKYPVSGAPTVVYSTLDLVPFDTTGGGVLSYGQCPAAAVAQKFGPEVVAYNDGSCRKIELFKVFNPDGSRALEAYEQDFVTPVANFDPLNILKQDLSFHQSQLAWYPNPGGGMAGAAIPAGYVGYDFDLAGGQYPGVTNASDFYVHIVYAPTGPYYMPPGTGAGTAGSTAIAAIQALINSAITAAPLSWPADSVIFQVNPSGSVTVWYAPAYDPNVIGHQINFWAGPSAAAGNYTNKDTPNLPTVNTPATLGAACKLINYVLSSNPCGQVVTKGYELDGSAVVGFDPAKVMQGDTTYRNICAAMVGGAIWNLVEATSPCGTVVYLDPDVSPMAAVATSTIDSVLHGGACDCNSVALPAMATRLSYSGGMFGQNYCSDKFSTDIKWTVHVWKNGTEIYTSAQSPSLASVAAAAAWLNANSAGYLTIENPLPSAPPNHQFTYTAPAATNADEYLIVVEEAATGATPICGPLFAAVSYGYSNKALAFGSGSDEADALASGGTIDWATRSGYAWHYA